MRTENVQILVGSPDSVEKKVQAYLNENKNSEVLSTAINVRDVPVTPKAAKAAPAKNAAKQAANAEKDATAAQATLLAVETKPVITVAVTVARVWR